ncbi:UbiA family prenyltransferase [Streptomyces sp. NPDC049555]|uniref:UbiA family prenyltransferase n=1 Tax=unclassified Streptomyces TaxID=2593676 RepID=UPI003437CBE3
MTERLRALYGFSRGTQAGLSVAQPLIGALIVTDHPSLPRLSTMTLAALAGYVAVFAANDLMDARLDRRRFAHERAYDGFDLDSTGARHPLARGQLSTVAAVVWVGGLAVLAATLCAALEPMCLALFAAAVALQIGYCLLATVSHYKFVLSGLMVGAGALAGAFAMPVRRPVIPLLLLAVWMIAWEVGGRNIVNDMADVDEDVHLGIRTVPVVYGLRTASILACGCSLLAAAASVGLALHRWSSFGPVGLAGAVLATAGTVLAPAVRLMRDPGPRMAMKMFNRASLQPVCLLVAFVVAVLLRR